MGKDRAHLPSDLDFLTYLNPDLLIQTNLVLDVDGDVGVWCQSLILSLFLD
jgi:hypothetical protein